MRNLFGNTKMSWPVVLVFAIIAGVYTGCIMLVNSLDNTSFQDIGVSYEWWVIFAVIIVVNCEKSWEAALKCFVFFVISQPVIYGVEVLAGHLTLEMAIYYYKLTWMGMTLLTLPGGFIAYFCKKQNLLGAIILGIGNTIQAVMGAYYASQAISSFPNHLLSAIVSFASILVMSFYIQKQKVYSLISVIMPLVIVLILIIVGPSIGVNIV